MSLSIILVLMKASLTNSVPRRRRRLNSPHLAIQNFKHYASCCPSVYEFSWCALGKAIGSVSQPRRTSLRVRAELVSVSLTD